MIRVVNLEKTFSSFHDHWTPKIAGEINDCHLKLAKLKGEFIWHHHENEDELFLVLRGTLRMKVSEAGSEQELMIKPGEFVIIPRGVEHLPERRRRSSHPAAGAENHAQYRQRKE